MKLVQELFEELETKAKAASAMGERFEMDPGQLLTLIKAARGKRESLGLLETGDLKPGFYEFSHSLYMVGHDFRFKGPFETLEEAQEELGISQVEIDQAFFKNGREKPTIFEGYHEQYSENVDDQGPTECLENNNIGDVGNEPESDTGIEALSGPTFELDKQNVHSDSSEAFEQPHPEEIPEHIR